MNARADRPSKYVSETQMPRLDLWARLKERRKPASFELETTARCNNDCRHCYVNLPENDAEAEAKELTLSETLDIARQATELGAMWCLVTGGEPLLRDDLGDLYLGLKKLGLLVSVFTNACLVTPEHVELFDRYPPRDIEVTVYGATEATYERVTHRRGSYAAFRRGLDLLLDGGVPVRLKAMALRSNVHEFDEMAAFCRKHTRDYYRFDPLIHLRYDGDPRRNEEIRGERLTPREIVELERRDPERLSYMREHCHELIEDSRESADRNALFTCGAGLDSFTVTYDGRLRLCSALGHPDCVYDLGSGSLEEAWTEFIPSVRDLRSSDADFLARCASCHLVNLCLWCPAHAFLEAGRLDAVPKHFCASALARAEVVGHGETD